MTSCCCWALLSSITCWACCLSFFSHSLMFIVVTSHLFLFSKSLLRVASVFSPFKVTQVVFPSLGWSSCSPFESFVEMMSPRFHSAAFLVHLSGLGVAIRRACRHFSFFFVSTQIVMLDVNICSSASSVILFTCSFQSSRLSSWLAVLPFIIIE